ncbi:MAG TPA: undecaprenyl-diphosphate phosphatase [Acidimicrobiales bacterium]
MPILHAIVLGIVQGLSEFLPISSSGHLEIVPWLVGWDDFAGRPDLERAFDVAVHVGTLAGAIAYFRADLWRYALAAWSWVGERISSTGVAPPGPGPAGSAPDDAPFAAADADVDRVRDQRIAGLLVVSAVPAGVVGLTLADALEGPAENHVLIGTLLVVFGLLLLWADRIGGVRPAGSWTRRDALIMGLAQAAALQPGVSRSGVTITAGRWLGLTRHAAARLSFLMSVPVIAGAGVVAWRDAAGTGGIPTDLYPPVAWAVAASAITGYLAVWGTIRLVQTRSFAPFVVYRVLVGAGVVLVAVTGLR